ncbi:MAG: hypothetical protein NT001_01080 [Candidatus Woesearchaeota archaeon]|nr:hypothetical protein [Candidatus Woesearchaeota archaeon]
MVHPDAEFIVKGIGSRLVNGKEWKSFLKSVKGCKLTIERCSFNPKRPLISTRKDFERILARLIKKRNPEHKDFMGFYIFPDDGRLHISEVSLLNLIGSMAGDIVIEKTGLVATSWYAPKCWNSAPSTRPFNFNLPKINIMLIERKR